MTPGELKAIEERDAKADAHLHSTFEGSPLLMKSLKACISHAEYDRRALLVYIRELQAEIAILKLSKAKPARGIMGGPIGD